MKKIKSIDFSHLRNEAHYEFLWVFRHLVDEFPAVKTLVGVLYEDFITLLVLEKKLLDAARVSALTQQLVEADHRVDRAITAIRAVINAARHSLDPAVAEAARVLYIRLREFGDIRGKAYEEESAAVQVLIDDLGNTYVQQTSLVGLQSWLTELTTAEAEFTRLYLQRGSEAAGRPTERMADVHREIEEKYRNIATFVDVSSITTPGEYDGFIAKLNVQVQYFNEHNHRPARKDLGAGDHTVIEPIETQQYTGRPITIIPEVHFREEGKETKRLYLGEDFSVTYKNNVEVGQAELTIHGKGEYKGQKSLSFHIAR
jgi:hypothetical protein